MGKAGCRSVCIAWLVAETDAQVNGGRFADDKLRRDKIGAERLVAVSRADSSA